jgi:pimeloyl-ACP methyl ester carboxylesterase
MDVITPPEPFRIAVPDAALSDLRSRLARTKYPRQTPAEPWGAGVDIPYLSGLMTDWRESFDWRAAEERLNEVPQFIAEIGGARIHFAHLRAERVEGGAEPIPIILSHGWPYSFIEMLPLARLLSADGFDVVVPSLPGFGFSEPMREPFVSTAVAERWHALMTQVLGYPTYATYGEDVGTWVSDRLAALHPGSVVALFATHAAFPPDDRRDDITEEEQAFLDWLDRKWKRASAYSMQQSTRPDTLAVGLTDSPAGLAAWLLEKFREWSGTDDVEDYWTRDELLTTISLYWFTETIGTSFRAYFDDRLETPMPLIDVPVGVSIQYGERGFPRHYAERTYTDIRFWNDLPSGGHFTAKQSPELVAADMRTFFRALA